ncbi:MAG: thiamine pyrophosphate-dependent enzyme, partial [Gammaproteobacteria bacterium]|nr:thiamine pyrophosphate-dependent enzyme [Gammaproteobacteria bacterium]
SSRLPYHVNTYGFHTIHGRAPAIATGVKLANPELDVWVITGDGDGLSIGGNHLLHALRRNINLNILLFNNEIYGLTKGQYSPTSRIGTASPSSPKGSIDSPIQPCLFAIGAGATFIARAVDIDQKGLPPLLSEAREHKGTAFVEILQNCIVYNKDVFDDVVARKMAAETQIKLTHGAPLIYGKANDKGLMLNKKSLAIESVELGENGITEQDLLIHDETNPVLAQLLATMSPPMPVAMGVILRQEKPAFEEAYWAHKPAHRRARVKALLRLGNLLDRRDK